MRSVFAPERLESRRMLAADLVADIGGIYPTEAVTIAGVSFFAADDGVHGTELWRSDGTPSGTVMVRDIARGSGSASLSSLRAVGDRVMFLTTRSGKTTLWGSNGTKSGTVAIAEFGTDFEDRFMAVVGNKLVYLLNRGDDDHQAASVWATDGTLAGTTQIIDLPEDDSINRGWFGRVVSTGDRAIFLSFREIWSTDGTTAGTIDLTHDTGIISRGDPWPALDHPTAAGDYVLFEQMSAQQALGYGRHSRGHSAVPQLDQRHVYRL